MNTPSQNRGCLYAALGAFTLAVVVIVVVVIAAARTVKTTPGSGTSQHPAAADVSLNSCSAEPPLNFPVARGTVLNHSSRKSDYTFTVSFLSSTGTVVGHGVAAERDITPGQSATFTVFGANAVSGPISCKVVDVTRFASS